jgi:hypothetical protein
MSARWSWSLAAVGLVLLGTWAFFRFASVTEVRGRVFIVQRDAHVNRLALLRVTAIPAEEAARWKDSRRADWRFLQRRLAENDLERTAEVAASVSPFDAKLSALAQQIAAASEALELADHA